MSQMSYADRQLETALTAMFEQKVTENRSTMRYWPAVSDRLGEQVSRRPWEYVMDAINRPRVPFNKQYIYAAGSALVVVIAVLLLVLLLNTDDGTSGENVPADTPEQILPDADAEPAGGVPAPGPTPIAQLIVPGGLAPFENLAVRHMGEELPGNNLVDNLKFSSRVATIPKALEISRREDLWRFQLTDIRLKLLVFAPGVDPFAQEDSTLSADDDGVIEVPGYNAGSFPAQTEAGQELTTSLLFSVNDERLIVVEEFAMCGDGRGVYLEHSTKPVEVGETFAYEIYADADDTPGDIHMVLIAAPDSPITHDGPDPKRLDLKWTPNFELMWADVGVTIVGIIAEGGPEVKEMCS